MPPRIRLRRPSTSSHFQILTSQINWCVWVFFFFFSCPHPHLFFLFYLACSSCDYLETRALCLCMFVSVFPLTLHRVAAGPSTVPVDQVSLCLCLLLRLAWQKPINTTLPPLYLLFPLIPKDDSCFAKAHKDLQIRFSAFSSR